MSHITPEGKWRCTSQDVLLSTALYVAPFVGVTWVAKEAERARAGLPETGGKGR